MRKTSFAIIVISLLMIAACKKYNCGSPGGNWTLGPQNYPACMCTVNTNLSELFAEEQILSSTTNQFVQQAVGIYFFNAVPSIADTFKAVTIAGATKQVAIWAWVYGEANGPTGAATYLSTSGTVFIGVSGGKLTATGSGITMENVSDTTDIRTLSLNIHQTE